MRKTVIGIMDSNIGGVNRFITDYISKQGTKQSFVILFSSDISFIYKKELSDSCIFEKICSITHPIKLYKLSRQIFITYNIDELYLNISTNLFFPILKAAYDSGVTVRILHSHSSYSSEENFLKRICIVFINKILQKYVNQITTVKKACSDKAARWLFGNVDDYEFVYNTVNKSKFLFSADLRHKIRNSLALNELFVIGVVGGFNYAKNTEYFIYIAQRLLKKNIKFKILIVGDGPSRQQFETELAKKNIESKFLLLGNISNTFDYYNAFDCFVMPSRFEGLPIAGIEAQINGLRCFFSNVITSSVKITEECKFFDLKSSELVEYLSTLDIDENHQRNLLPEYYKFTH